VVSATDPHGRNLGFLDPDSQRQNIISQFSREDPSGN
jgi:hypothetical protein